MKKIIVITLVLVFLMNGIGLTADDDKITHFAAGVVIEYTAEQLELDSPMKLVIVIACAKEVAAYYGSGNAELADIGATMLGGYVLNYHF